MLRILLSGALLFLTTNIQRIHEIDCTANQYTRDHGVTTASATLNPPGSGFALPGTELLTWEDPLDSLMREGIHRFLDRKTASSEKRRVRHWNRDPSNGIEYAKSVAANRKHLARIIGVADTRAQPEMHGVTSDEPVLVARMPAYEIYEVRWPALEPIPDLTASATVKQADWARLTGPVQVEGEGLLLKSRGLAYGCVIVLPDADQTPEQLAGLAPGIDPESQLVRRLAENGFNVICPVLLSRDTIFSKGIKSNRRTHRDWIYTPAFEVGRHPIGYEVQKALAAADWCRMTEGDEMKIALAGYGEGGQIAMYAAALDTRIEAAFISGYFGPRNDLWREPLYRNIWALLDEFGDAEIATLIAPRSLIIEYSRGPEWQRNVEHTGPGELSTPSFDEVNHEFHRIDRLIPPDFGIRTLISGKDGTRMPFGSERGLRHLAERMGKISDMALSENLPVDSRSNFDPLARQERAVKQMENHTQLLLRNAEYHRDAVILPRLSFQSIEAYEESAEKLRREFQYEHIGWLDEPLLEELNPRSRKIYDRKHWEGYDVVVDVWPEVFAWGVLCIPKNISPGEKRPVVICQHGLEGTPYHTIDTSGRAYAGYKSFAARLAEEGYVTFAPHNLYRGGNEFRSMQRKANPLKASLFSIITPQHSQILNWLESLPFVDKNRIGFYGLSYGGKSAMRIAAIERRYRLSICSGDFNEWVRVNADIHFKDAYMYRGPEYEMVEWDLGHSFNYAEMTYLIAPRPFMVERGRSDGVGIDPWIAYEFDRARRVYDDLGIGDRCVIEYFDGPHTIHGVGTFAFLRRELECTKK
jgi:dienelactone hydrolase